MGNLESYIKARDNGMTMEEIQKEEYLSEATMYCWEIGYQCYLKRLPLDKALALVSR